MKIIDMHRIKNPQGKIRAFFAIDFGHILVRDCKLIQGADGLWAAMPNLRYKDKNGQEKFAGIVQIKDTKIMDVITNAARDLYEASGKEGENVELA